MSLNKLKKDELKIVAEELNLTVPEGAKIAGLKSLIVNSDVYKKDKELVQSAIDYALAEIKNKRLDSETKLEFERIKLAQLQKQLELSNIQKNLPQNSDIRNQSVFETAANINVETLLKSVKTLTILVPSRVESYNLFFLSLEKAFKIKEVPEQLKGEILLNILGERVNNLLVHVSEEELNNYKEVEEPIVKNKERLICEEHYANTHFRTKEGKYVVSMPLKKESSCLGNSKDIALKRLGSLWNRLARDENYLNLYREFLRDYERLGHMKEVTNEIEPEITYYATHHGIYRPEMSTTKLIVVFNCSSLTDNGISLNNIQYNGGVIQEDLYAQVLRFRTYTYAFTTDIKMMYRTIFINPKQRNLQRIVWCESAGTELHKLCANHEKLSPDPEQNYNFATLTETKTLGVSWKPNLDCFLIKVKVCLDSSYTKRDILSTIAKIFDPVGLMAPVISKAKIFLQQVTEIHGFTDASEWCYGAAVYCKSKHLKSETLVWLITSKSRVAPIKSLTIPRLELCAAILLAKLVKRVVAALQLETAEVYLWSDLMIVLAWLRKEPMDLKTFVQNRVAKIQELYPNQLWRHVPSDQNPADLVS
ncbi:uncharacterized protein TNCV_938181 [Trichonephila clavipes]|nr:uncharacterized protein TNCV_938181 [Trichonephila clavipes]